MREGQRSESGATQLVMALTSDSQPCPESSLNAARLTAWQRLTFLRLCLRPTGEKSENAEDPSEDISVQI